MIIKTYEDVMNLQVGKQYFIYHPTDNTLVSCIYKEPLNDKYYLRPIQYGSSGLACNTKEILAERIVSKSFRLNKPRKYNGL